MSDLDLTIPSAATLELPGSIGTFSITPKDSHPYFDPLHASPVTVTYFLTYVTLTGGVEQQLLSHLSPVREVFQLEQLEFDELMQRDIDDARVADELIPYVLDPRTAQLVKLFPPIVVTVMPIGETAAKPGRVYPSVLKQVVKQPEKGYDLNVIQSGDTGSEIFRIERPTREDHTWNHDLARFHLNPQGCRLVIVDGQHRAMALLALHRNRNNEWSDKTRAPYAPFYSQWSADVLAHYDLSQICLPVMLCTILEMDENYTGDFDLLQANRSIFLALNKNARRVTEARNRLLDDNDIVAECLRELLNSFKNRPDVGTSAAGTKSPPLWCVELNQESDRVRLSTPAAITGVNHLYTLILHLVMREHYTLGAKQSGRLERRRRLDEMVQRLGLQDELGPEATDTLRRDNYDSEAARLIRSAFMSVYGEAILQLFSDFPLLRRHIESFSKQYDVIQEQEPPEIERLVFGGEGVSTAIEDHNKRLRRQISAEHPLVDLDEANDALKQLGRFRKRTEDHVSQARDHLRHNLLPSTGPALPSIVRDEVFRLAELARSTAFQVAMVASFAEIADKVCEQAEEEDPDVERAPIFEAMSDEYSNCLAQWFDTSDRQVLSKICEVFLGLPLESIDEESAHSVDSFRSVVFGSAELQPRAWPRLRVLFLEIWQSNNATVQSHLEEEREACWYDIVESLFARLLRERAQELATRPESLDPTTVHQVFENSVLRTESLLGRFRESSFDRDAVWEFMVEAGHVGEEEEEVEYEEGDYDAGMNEGVL